MTGRRDLLFDEHESRSEGEPMVTPAGDARADGSHWELVDPEFRYGEEGPYEDLVSPKEQ